MLIKTKWFDQKLQNKRVTAYICLEIILIRLLLPRNHLFWWYIQCNQVQKVNMTVCNVICSLWRQHELARYYILYRNLIPEITVVEFDLTLKLYLMHPPRHRVTDISRPSCIQWFGPVFSTHCSPKLFSWFPIKSNEIIPDDLPHVQQMPQMRTISKEVGE